MTGPSKHPQPCDKSALSALPESIRERVDVDTQTGCWLWTAGLMSAGYPQVYWKDGRTPTGGHRLAYTLLIGPIPDGTQIDHLCRVRRCMNPEHLEPVTSRENTLRGEGPTAHNARKTHCKRGHEFTPENTYIQRARGQVKGRGCRTCARESMRARRSAARAA